MADGITYGGQPVVLDWTGNLQSRLETFWQQSRWPLRQTSIGSPLAHSLFPEAPDRIFESPYPLLPKPVLNELIIPTGAARYSSALILMDEASYWQLHGSDSSGTPEDATNASPLPLRFEYGGSVIERQMYALTPFVIDASGADLLAVPLVDRRYFWLNDLRRWNVAGDQTWAQLFDQISGMISADIEHPEIAASYLIPDAETYRTEGLSIAHLLDAAALSVGLRAVYTDAGGGTVILQSATQASTSRNASVSSFGKWAIMGGFAPRHPIPESLQLICRTLHNFYRNCGQFVQSHAFVADDQFPNSISIHSTMWAQYTLGVIDVLSAYQLAALAEQLAQDLEAWMVSSLPLSMVGVANWNLSGHDDYLSVRHDHTAGIVTQVQAMPQDFAPFLQMSQAPGNFWHIEDGIICRLLGDVTAMDPETLQLGSGLARPMRVLATGQLVDRVRSNGTPITITVFNGSIEPITVEEDGPPPIIQCKRLNCLPVIDVEYCIEGAPS